MYKTKKLSLFSFPPFLSQHLCFLNFFYECCQHMCGIIIFWLCFFPIYFHLLWCDSKTSFTLCYVTFRSIQWFEWPSGGNSTNVLRFPKCAKKTVKSSLSFCTFGIYGRKMLTSLIWKQVQSTHLQKLYHKKVDRIADVNWSNPFLVLFISEVVENYWWDFYHFLENLVRYNQHFQRCLQTVSMQSVCLIRK